MKKSLILSLIVAAAADAAPIYDAYTDNLPPRRPEPYYSVEYEDVVSNNPFGIEISATYSNMLTSIHEDYDMEHVGADLTGIYNFNNQFIIRKYRSNTCHRNTVCYNNSVKAHFIFK